MTTKILIHQKFTAQQAINAMITGIEKALDKSDKGDYTNFKLDMGTFGRKSGNSATCYGCAATVALQELYGYVFTPKDYTHKDDDELTPERHHARALTENVATSIDSLDVFNFEHAVDSFREGSLQPLFEYFNEEIPSEAVDGVSPWNMKDGVRNIKKELPKIKEFYKKAYT